MIVGGVVAFIFGVDAERKSLEAITSPLSAVNPTQWNSLEDPDPQTKRQRRRSD
jgi:hypothetical protein